MKKLIRSVFFFLLIIVFYLLLWPVSIEPASWVSPPDPGYVGVYAPNDVLGKVNVQHHACKQCEDVAIDKQGRVYGASSDGAILRFDKGGIEATVLANTGGRPLGLDFDPQGNLYIADAHKGLLRLNSDGNLETLETTHNGRPFLFTDDLEVGPDGKVYFSDASDTNGIEGYVLDLLAHKPAGRLLVYNPQTKKVDQLLEQLYFANGIATSADSSFVLVNETGAYRVMKYYLKGAKAGQAEVFIEHLPAFPDGISSGSDGIFWLALISPRNSLIDNLSEKPFLRKVIARLPKWIQPAPERYAAVLGLNAQGEVVYNFQDPNGKFAQISSVQQWNDDLYFGSLGEEGVGILSGFKQLK